MWLFYTTADFFWGFLVSRNYKIQEVAHVEGKSAVLLSGRSEASWRHFFIGQIAGCSRARSCRLSTSFKNYHSEASRHPGGRRIELSSKSSTLLMKRFLCRTNLPKKSACMSNNNMEEYSPKKVRKIGKIGTGD